MWHCYENTIYEIGRPKNSIKVKTRNDLHKKMYENIPKNINGSTYLIKIKYQKQFIFIFLNNDFLKNLKKSIFLKIY